MPPRAIQQRSIVLGHTPLVGPSIFVATVLPHLASLVKDPGRNPTTVAAITFLSGTDGPLFAPRPELNRLFGLALLAVSVRR